MWPVPLVYMVLIEALIRASRRVALLVGFYTQVLIKLEVIIALPLLSHITNRISVTIQRLVVSEVLKV